MRAVREFAVVTSIAMALAAPAAAQAACSTSDPSGDTNPASSWTTDSGIEANFDTARAAEGCDVPLVLPAGYDQMSYAEQTDWLYNSEREVRGLSPLQLDQTLLGQVAQGHSHEMAIYNWSGHASAINNPAPGRWDVNPGIASNNMASAENVDEAASSAAETTYVYMYQDAEEQWGHREDILGDYNWLGVGLASEPEGANEWGSYETSDLMAMSPGYAPPSHADTAPPLMGTVSYAGGMAKVTDVRADPANTNDVGPDPVTAGITGVVFYTDEIVQNQADNAVYNTVTAKQVGNSGTWEANISVGRGQILHAVAVDGSGNFTDLTPPPPPVHLRRGVNDIAVPPIGEKGGQIPPVGELNPPPATPTAAALVKSINRQARAKVVKSVSVFEGGRWHVYRPGRSRSFRLTTSLGIVVRMTHAATWRPPAGQEVPYTESIDLRGGRWNFIAIPYPTTGLSIGTLVNDMEYNTVGEPTEFAFGSSSKTGRKFKSDAQGNWSQTADNVPIPDGAGFWLRSGSSGTWNSLING